MASLIGQHDEQVPRGAGLYMSGFPAMCNKQKIFYEYIRTSRSMQICNKTIEMQAFYVHFGHIKETLLLSIPIRLCLSYNGRISNKCFLGCAYVCAIWYWNHSSLKLAFKMDKPMPWYCYWTMLLLITCNFLW